MTTAKAENIDDYISAFPKDVQKQLQEVRGVIGRTAPDAEETISYAIPTFKLNGNLVHFAAFKNHIGFYPGASGIKAFQKELSAYAGAKGSVQFPHGEPLPLDLIRRIVKFRIEENLKKKSAKKSARRAPSKAR